MAGIETIYLNPYQAEREGRHVLGPTPQDSGDSQRSIYGYAQYGGGMSGRFRFEALDVENEPKTVIGGFRNLRVTGK